MALQSKLLVLCIKLANNLRQFLVLQAAVTLVSLPILVLHGLPFSHLAILGNLFFSPVLAAFIFLSSLLFFTKIVGVSAVFLAPCHEALSWLWLQVLSLASTQALFCVSIFELIFYLFLFFACYRVLFLVGKFSWSRVLLVWFSLFTMGNLPWPKRLVQKLCFSGLAWHVQKKRGVAEVVMTQQGLVLQDQSFLRQFKDIKSYLDFELRPELARRFGSWRFAAVDSADKSARAQAAQQVLLA